MLKYLNKLMYQHTLMNISEYIYKKKTFLDNLWLHLFYSYSSRINIFIVVVISFSTLCFLFWYIFFTPLKTCLSFVFIWFVHYLSCVLISVLYLPNSVELSQYICWCVPHRGGGLPPPCHTPTLEGGGRSQSNIACPSERFPQVKYQIVTETQTHKNTALPPKQVNFVNIILN